MFPSAKSVASALREDPQFAGDFTAYEQYLPLLIEIIEQAGYMDCPVTMEGICLTHAEIIEHAVLHTSDPHLQTSLKRNAQTLRSFVADPTAFIGDATDDQILTAKGSSLNPAAVELFMDGSLTFTNLLLVSPSTLLPELS